MMVEQISFRSLSTPAFLTITDAFRLFRFINIGNLCWKPVMRDNNGSGRKKPTPMVLVSGTADDAMRAVVPPHLARTGWITHEANCAIAVYQDLRKDLRDLKKKVTANRVHRARVTLRRWFSVWKVLSADRWESKSYAEGVGKRLRKLQKLLGELRDVDVNIEQATKLGVTKPLIDAWTRQRKTLEQKLVKYVEKTDLRDLMDKLGRYLGKRAQKIQARLPRAKAEQSAYQHIELYLLQQESIVRERAQLATTPEEFHELRLGIKGWRYVLTEFFGVTNLELVRAQQLLGQMHDLDRLTPLLVHDEEQEEALARLKQRRKELLAQIQEMRTRLPYGLRPQITSTKAALPAGFGELRT
jgi:CHAD domain-containing protein